jgi:hypothetical protein
MSLWNKLKFWEKSKPEIIDLQPVMIVTIYRRYWELVKLLRLLELYKNEFLIPPKLVVVYAQPEEHRLKWFRRLKKMKRIYHTILREGLVGENDVGTTYAESHNIDLARKYIEEEFKEIPHYILMNTPDIWTYSGTYKYVDEKMQNGEHYVFFNYAQNYKCISTYFFALKSGFSPWPPVVHKATGQILEQQWGELFNNDPKIPKEFWDSIVQKSNKFFAHMHEREGQKKWLKKLPSTKT